MMRKIDITLKRKKRESQNPVFQTYSFSIPKSMAPTRTHAFVTSRQRLQLKLELIRRFDSLCNQNQSIEMSRLTA